MVGLDDHEAGRGDRPLAVVEHREEFLAAPLRRVVAHAERVLLAVDQRVPRLARQPPDLLEPHQRHGLVLGQRHLLRRRARLLLPGLERLAVAADVLAGAAEREQQQVLAGLPVDHLAPDLGRDPDELALAELVASRPRRSA